MASTEGQARWRDRKERRARGELECERLKWVSLEDRRDLVAAGFLDSADIHDPDAVTAAREAVLAMVRENIRQKKNSQRV